MLVMGGENGFCLSLWCGSYDMFWDAVFGYPRLIICKLHMLKVSIVFVVVVV